MIPSASSTHALRVIAPKRSPRPERWRRCLATAALLAAVGALAWPTLELLAGIAHGTRHWPGKTDLVLYAFLALPVLCVAASAWLLHLRWLPAQVAVRASSWALLVIATIGCLSGSERLGWVIATAAVGAAVSLLALGRLDTGGGAFSPLRHRGALLLGLVLALADAGTLLFWGGLASLGAALHGHEDALLAAAFYLPSAGLMLAAVLGVYRLRLWGVVLNVVANVGVAALLLAWNPGDLPFAFRFPLVATAALQLLLLFPLLRSLAGKPSNLDAWRGWRLLPSAVVLALVGLDLLAVFALAGPVLRL